MKGLRKPVPMKAGKRETPKTVYNRKHLEKATEAFSEFVDWLGTEVKWSPNKRRTR